MSNAKTVPSDTELLPDPEAAALFNLGITKFLELQKRPGFPKPIWLGPRGKRHVRSELLAWAFEQREVPA